MYPRLVLLLATAGTAALAQSVSLQGVFSGLLHDGPSRSIRPVAGVPGASYLGAAVLSGADEAFIAPDGSCAIVVEDGRPVVVTALGGDVQRNPLFEAIERPERVVWSADSRTAIIQLAGSRKVLRVDVSGTPRVVQTFDLSSLEGTIAGLATMGNAARTVVSVAHPTDGGLYEIGTGAPVKLADLPNPGAVAFASARTLFAIDRDARQILQFTDIDTSGPERLSFDGEDELLADPVALAVSAAGRDLFLAGAADRRIRIYDLPGRRLLHELAVDQPPRSLSRLPLAQDLFLLASRTDAGAPVWLLDATHSPKVMFVPAGK